MNSRQPSAISSQPAGARIPSRPHLRGNPFPHLLLLIRVVCCFFREARYQHDYCDLSWSVAFRLALAIARERLRFWWHVGPESSPVIPAPIHRQPEPTPAPPPVEPVSSPVVSTRYRDWHCVDCARSFRRPVNREYVYDQTLN